MPDLSAHTNVLGERLAAHLLRRATFGPTKAQIQAFAAKTPQQALVDLLVFNPITNKPIDPVTNATWVDTFPIPVAGSDDNFLRDCVIAWLLDNSRTDNTLRSKMMFFLHQNWIVNDESWNSHDLYDHVKLLEFYSLGSYKTLAKKMCMDNRMLVYLNGFQNYANNPNENFAREFLELFTIGKGPQIAAGNYTNYTEDDIKQAAKLLSGYNYSFVTWTNPITLPELDPDTNIRRCSVNPASWSHSNVNKTFSAAFQNTVITGTSTTTGMATELDSFVTMVFNQNETAKNICRKLYRYFVHRNITAAVETDIIVPMATNLKANNYNLSVALNQLLQSKHFYDLDDANALDNKVGGMVKSPLMLLMQTLRFFSISPFDMTTPVVATPNTVWTEFYRNSVREAFCRNSDMYIFNSTTVAGYPAYYLAPKYDKHWFDNSTITQRYYLAKCLIENKRWPYSSWAIFGAQINIVTWVQNNITNPADPNKVVDELINYLLPEVPDAARRNYFFNNVLLGNVANTWATDWANYINNGTLTIVKPRLEALFKAILFSQEYQLH
jgi:uncharacterized protein (DUF1800 family)